MLVLFRIIQFQKPKLKLEDINKQNFNQMKLVSSSLYGLTVSLSKSRIMLNFTTTFAPSFARKKYHVLHHFNLEETRKATSSLKNTLETLSPKKSHITYAAGPLTDDIFWIKDSQFKELLGPNKLLRCMKYSI